MKAIFLASFLTLLCFATLARLGETNSQIYQRYGAVIKRYEDGPSQWHAGYLFKNYVIVVFYSNNVSQAEVVKPTSDRDFTSDEVQTLMRTIGGGSSWVEYTNEDDPGQKSWTNTTDSVATWVSSGKGSPYLSVSTRAFVIQGAQYGNQQKDKTDGF